MSLLLLLFLQLNQCVLTPASYCKCWCRGRSHRSVCSGDTGDAPYRQRRERRRASNQRCAHLGIVEAGAKLHLEMLVNGGPQHQRAP